MEKMLNLIRTRQSIGDVKPETVARETIEKLLEAAVQAPNHYRVRPWRFVVLTGPGRERLGQVLARSFQARFPNAPAAALEKERQKPLRAPVLIAVGVDRSNEAKVLEVENIAAVAAAVENLLLAAQALGLAAKWRTGEEARDPLVKEFLGFAPDQHLIALLYIGTPLTAPPPVSRPGFEDRVVWIEK